MAGKRHHAKEVEAIKARGVGQMLHQLQQGLEDVRPPDLAEAAELATAAWKKYLGEEARGNAAVLLNTLEPYRTEVEHYFAIERQRLFHGVMASYLYWFNRLKYISSNLHNHIPFVPKISTQVNTPAEWDLAKFTLECSRVAAEKHLDARNAALADRLLVLANDEHFPVDLLKEPTEAAAHLDWSHRNQQALIEVLGRIETVWTRPTGFKRVVQGITVFVADWLPLLGGIAMFVYLALVYCKLLPTNMIVDVGHDLKLLDVFLVPLGVVVLTLVLLHMVIAVILPLRWLAIRAELEKYLESRLLVDLEKEFCQVPHDVAKLLREERQEVEKVLTEVREVTGWLEEREQSSSIKELYGHAGK